MHWRQHLVDFENTTEFSITKTRTCNGSLKHIAISKFHLGKYRTIVIANSLYAVFNSYEMEKERFQLLLIPETSKVFKLHCFVLSNINDYSIYVTLQYQLSRLR